MYQFKIGDRLDHQRYEIVGRIYHDEAVAIYRAIDQQTVQPVTLKIWQRENTSADVIGQLSEECQLLMLQPTTSGFIHIEHFFVDERAVCVVMEDLPYPLLRDHLMTADLTSDQVMKLIRELIKLVRTINTHEFIHRSISLDKIFMTPLGLKIGGISYSKVEERMYLKNGTLSAESHGQTETVRDTIRAIVSAYGRQLEGTANRPALEVGLMGLRSHVDRDVFEEFLNKKSSTDMAIRIMPQSELNRLFLSRTIETKQKKKFKLSLGWVIALVVVALVGLFGWQASQKVFEALQPLPPVVVEVESPQAAEPQAEEVASPLEDRPEWVMPPLEIINQDYMIYDMGSEKILRWTHFEDAEVVNLSLINVVTGNKYAAMISGKYDKFDLDTLFLDPGYYEVTVFYEKGLERSKNAAFSFGIREPKE